MKTADVVALPHRNHYVTLDGLRGLAALAVFLFHLSYFWPSGKILPRAYIAVDFFFLLSGFVIAKSYEAKLRHTMPLGQFIRLRLIRLYPLICLGILLGLIDELMKLHAGPHEAIAGIFLEAAAGLLILPDITGNIPQLFPLNPPSWSLFYELLVNFAYAAMVKRLGFRFIGALCLIAGLGLIAIGLATGDTGGGASPAAFPAGLSRVIFSFFLGVLLFRLQSRGLFARLPGIPGLWLLAVLLLSFLPGDFRGGWIYNLFCVFLLFPLIIVLGAKDNLPRRTLPAAIWLGRISYPLYALHFPLIVRNSYHLTHGRHGLALAGATIFLVILGLAFAWLAVAFYDEPVRRMLSRTARRSTTPAPVLEQLNGPKTPALPDTTTSTALAD